MARIRSIKPELPHDAKLATVSLQARYTFILLITIADDQGYFRATPRQLLGQLYPHDRDVDEAQLEAWLSALADVGVVEWSETDDGVRVGRLVNWHKHQKIDRPNRSYLASAVGDDGQATMFVYAFRRPTDGAIKIGVSRDPRSRSEDLARMLGTELTFLGCAPGDRAMERKAHQRFVRCALGGEWFRPEPEVLLWVAATLTASTFPIFQPPAADKPPTRSAADSRPGRRPPSGQESRSPESLSPESRVLSHEPGGRLPPTGELLPGLDTLLEKLEGPHLDAVEGYIRAAQFPREVIGTILAEGPDTGTNGAAGKTWPVIGQALVEMRAGGKSFTPIVFRAFIRRLLEAPPVRSGESPGDRARATADRLEKQGAKK